MLFKFRAWHKPTGRMIPWEWLSGLMDGNEIRVPFPNQKPRRYPMEPTWREMSIRPPCNPFSNPDFVMMQSTGLKESGRAEVYQGDIIDGNLAKYSLPTMGEIVYSLDYGSWASKNDGGITLIHELTSIRVVGNVHENPEWRR